MMGVGAGAGAAAGAAAVACAAGSNVAIKARMLKNSPVWAQHLFLNHPVMIFANACNRGLVGVWIAGCAQHGFKHGALNST